MPRGLESVSGHATPLGPAERDRIAVEQMLLAELVVPQQAVEAVRKYSAKKNTKWSARFGLEPRRICYESTDRRRPCSSRMLF